MVGGCVVGGVILDESVLFAEALNLKPGAEPLLRRMRHSGLRTVFHRFSNIRTCEFSVEMIDF